MKQLILTLLSIAISLTSFAKKDINAWKSENSLPQQYTTFKANLNYWNGSYFLNDFQLDEFYKSLTDTINKQKSQLKEKQAKIDELNSEIETRNGKIDETQTKLDKSLKLQNSISVLGIVINKHLYSVLMFLLIVGALVLAGFVFLMYKKSIATTRTMKNDYNDLKEEYETHKKSSLERYTHINMELHKTRLELQKKNNRS